MRRIEPSRRAVTVHPRARGGRLRGVAAGALLVGVLAALAPTPGAAQSSSNRSLRPLDRIVAVVDDDVIVMSELNDMMRTVREEMRTSGAPSPPTPVLERQVLDRLVLERLQLQEAERLGIRVQDDQLNRAVADIAKRNHLGLAEFRHILERDGISFASFRERIRKEMIIARVRQRQVGNRVRVREQEIDRYLELHAGQSAASEYRLSHILIAVPGDASADQVKAKEKVAEDLVRQLRAGADFTQLAARYSQGRQAQNGGDLGWRARDKLPSLFASVVPAMTKGEVKGPLRSASGFHIVKLTDVKGETKTVIRQTHVQHILIRPNELVSENDARLRLSQLRERVLQGEDFGELARANSDDRGSAIKDGDLGWVNPGDLVPEFEQVMNETPVGGVSEPFKTSFGWHILRVAERRNHDSTEEVKRHEALEAIKKRRTHDELEAWLAQLRDEAYVEYRLEE